jgi:prefoldin alpha subunit
MNPNEKKQQELMYRLSMFEQQIQLIQQQIEAINQAINESNLLNSGIENIKGAKNSEILASIGKGIYIKGKIVDEDLIVDVGGKKFVKKTAGETQNIINDQVKKLEEVKKDLENNLEKINEELGELFKSYQEL